MVDHVLLYMFLRRFHNELLQAIIAVEKEVIKSIPPTKVRVWRDGILFKLRPPEEEDDEGLWQWEEFFTETDSRFLGLYETLDQLNDEISILRPKGGEVE